MNSTTTLLVKRVLPLGAFLLAATLLACGQQWDLDAPIALSIESPEIPASAQAFFTDGLLQLGGHPQVRAAQVVHMDYQEVAICNGCTPNTVEHVDYHGDTIHIYGRYKLQPADGLEVNVKHGLIHVLGFEQHLPASTHAYMTPLYEDIRDHHRYQPADIAALCSHGRASGGVCKGAKP